MKKRIINYKKLVLEIMKENQIARDNDLILYSNLLNKFCYSPNVYSFEEIADLVTNGRLPDIQYISRCRRLVEREHPELRGKNYDKRHKIKSEVRTELNYIETPFDAVGMKP